MKSLQFPQVPVPQVKKIPHSIESHGDIRVDDYFWLRDKEHPDVLAHLHSENIYTDAMLSDVSELRETLFNEMKARIKADDQDVPVQIGEWLYYTRMEPGKQYAIYCRKHRNLKNTEINTEGIAEEIILDCNALSEGQKYFRLGVYKVSPDHNWLAYAVDLDGSEKFNLFFKHLPSGLLSPERITGCADSCEWAEDNKTVFYTILDEHQRPDRLIRHVIGNLPQQDSLVYKESDPQFFVFCKKSKSRQYLFLELHGKVTSEVYWLHADKPSDDFKVIEPRRRGVEYSVAHHGGYFYIVTNDVVANFRLVKTLVSAPAANNWQEVYSGSPNLYVQSVDAFRSHLVISERAQGVPQIRILDLASGEQHLVSFPEPTYSVRLSENPEFNTESLRFIYSSLVTPSTVIDYNMREQTRLVRKVQEIPSGYDLTKYRTERLMARAADGVEVPVSIVYRLDAQGQFELNGKHPLYLYGYGSYGMSIPVGFSTTRLSLLDRGFVFAIAHIRGGSDLGRQWYEDGKFLNKKNTFTDFVAVAEHMIKAGYTSEREIVIAGGSAGGMLVGATVNLRPELFKAVVAHVPFVDVINTMEDETLPLTTLEYEEWGNPNDPTYYHYMKSYSPYDNVAAKPYPHMFVTSGLNDPRVTYWEPAKWVAKLRELKTDNNLLLQHINMGAGHGGASGRYEALKLTAMEYAFILKVFTA
jgi:oligopeptidase B